MGKTTETSHDSIEQPEPKRSKSLSSIQETIKLLPHPIRLGIIFIVGVSILLTGVVLLVLPGPGIPLIFLGLMILASEFAWAGGVLRHSKNLGHNALKKIRNNGKPDGKPGSNAT